ncbi:MAG: glycerophosphodiester phosphodiesterase [Myxococcales bacterium]|nr:glycerophosphodiester phosphodiesterase [Myxococcales bacterium]MDH3484989.1 glycerophosphodiester phosphodiesterase [Myxococcales bacterium]
MNKLFLMVIPIAIAAMGCGSESEGTAGAGGTAGTGAVGGMGGTGGTAINCTTPEEILRCDGVVLNIAHRGGLRIRPEHTLVAYTQALADGADVLELDLHATSDGVIVVMHDDTIDRTTDGTGAIKEMTLAELKTYDAGYDFTPDDGMTYPYRGMGLLVPTLEEVLVAFPDVPYVIEIKQAVPSIVDDFVAITRARGVIRQINGASFDDDVLTELRAAAPELDTSFSLNEVAEYVQNTIGLEEAAPGYVPPAEFLQVPPSFDAFTVIHPTFISIAHQLGLKVHVWTINDEDEMRGLIADSADGIMTDDPPLLTTVIDDTGTGLPD